MKRYFIAMALAFIVPVSVLAVCAEGEVWQPEISYQNGQCLETRQSWSDNYGFRLLLGRWGCENVWHGTWFNRQCHITGHIINTCTRYEQIEIDNGQCVAVEEDDNEGDDSGDNGEDTGGNGEGTGGNEGGDDDTGTGNEDNENSNEGKEQGNSSSSGTSLWTRLSNVSGIKYTRDNISLQDGLALYDRIIKEKIEAWDNRNN